MSNDMNATYATMFTTSLVQNGSGIDDDNGPVSARGGRSIAGKGWLYAIAQAMGRLADQKAAQLETAVNNLPEDAKPSDMLTIQADTQEFSLMMNTFTNAIKTMGESNTTAGRKN